MHVGTNVFEPFCTIEAVFRDLNDNLKHIICPLILKFTPINSCSVLLFKGSIYTLNNKQLLDEVFVIFGIIKVEVTVH